MSVRRASRPGSDRGAVLLNAVVVISVVAAIGVTLLRDGQEGLSRYELMLRSDQARSYALAAEALAAELLAQDSGANDTDHLGEAWARDQGVIEIEGAALTATLYDLQGRLNLNRIVTRPEPPEDGTPPLASAPGTSLAEPYYDVLAELISDAEGPASLAPRLAEWIAEGVAGLPGPAGDRPYLGQEAPFLRPTEALLTPQDIRLVDGMEAAVFDTLGDSLAALPGLTAININTAPRPVLAALMPGLGPSQLDRFISYRAANPFASRGAFTEYVSRFLAPAGVSALGQLDIDVKTNWFLLEIAVEHGPSRARLFSVLERPDDGGRAEVVLRSGARL